MYNGIIGNGLRIQAAVKHKVFVSYHHDGDQAHYDAFSRTFHDTHETIHDNSLDRAFDSADTDYVMRRIREKHITGTSCTIVLIGEKTHGRKYVDWEINATLEKQHGLIGVYLPSAPRDSANRIIVPSRLHANIQSGFALFLSWNELTASVAHLQQHIADAKSRKVSLIDNTCERRFRNA